MHAILRRTHALAALIAAGGMALIAPGCGGGGAGGGAAGGGGGGGGGEAAVRLDREALEFSSDYGASPPPGSQLVTVDFDGAVLVLVSADGGALPDWVSAMASESSAGRVRFSIGVSDTYLPPGHRDAVLRFVTSRSDGAVIGHADLHLGYTVRDAAFLRPMEATLGANDERPTTVSVEVSDWNGNALPWTATADAGLRLAASAGAAGEPIQVSYDAAAQVLPPGHHQLRVRVSADLADRISTRDLPVTVEVGAHRIWAARNGVALTSVPGTSVLSASVPLVDNAGVVTGAWSARSDQPWLGASVLADTLLLEADPGGLADGVHQATVTITSTGPRLDAAEHVRVGLYTSGAPATTGLLAAGAMLRDPVVDPVRPWIWVLSQPDGLHARAYNAYSGAQEADVTLPFRAYHLALGTDGRTLYAGAYPNTAYQIYAYDLDAGAALPAIDGQGGSRGSDVAAFLRPSGHDVLATAEGDFYDAATGAIEPSPGTLLGTDFAWWMRASPDQRYVYGIDRLGSPAFFVRARMRYVGSPPALRLDDAAMATTLALPVAFMNRLAIAPDGLRACYPSLRNGRLVEFAVIGVATPDGPLTEVDSFLPAAQDAAPEAVQIAPDGRVVTLEGGRVVVYGALHGELARAHDVPLDTPYAELVLTSDGERAVVARSTGTQGATTELYGYPAR